MKKVILLFISIIFITTAKAQLLIFPLDTNAVTVNGRIATPEWRNANSIMIPVNSSDSVRVMFKHDGTAMYFAFTGKLESAPGLFPEVLTDAQNVSGTSWTSGQWWFHVSATDCENDGGYGIYNNCDTVQPGWEAVPNFQLGAPMTDTVELRIPFAKTGFNPATMDTMGMVLMVTNTLNAFHLYPTTADRNVPRTWTKAIFARAGASIPETTTQTALHIYPNPTNDVIHMNVKEEGTITITDVTGKVVHRSIVKGQMSISTYGWPTGTYTIQHVNKDRVLSTKVVKQ